MPKINEKRRPLAVGSYIFAGGFTVGVKKAGFDVIAHLEETKYGVATAVKNFTELPVYVGPETWPLDELSEGPEITFFYGNPPCAAWSNAGSATKKGRTWDSSPLVDCTKRHFESLFRVRPQVWAWESVQRAWTLGRSMIEEMACEARNFGYSTTIFLHNAQYLGVPQIRKRFFMVCHRIEMEFSMPSWKSETIEEALERVVERGDPLEHNLGRHRKLLEHVRPGENLSSAWSRLTLLTQQKRGDRGQMVGRPPFTIKRARSGQPAPVVMHELLHPTESRGLSIRELATLSGYPQDFEFVGANDAGQVGRGVCPPVGEYLARNVLRASRIAREVVVPEFRLVDYTKPPGRVEALRWSSSDVLDQQGEDDAEDIE